MQEPFQDVVESPGRPRLLEFLLISFKIGLFSFGGGITLLVHRDFVDRRRWLSEVEFASMVAVSQVLPGANVTNLLSAIGVRLFGVYAGLLAMVALLSGPSLVTVGLLFAFRMLGDVPHMQQAINGLAAASAGLIFLVAWKTGRATAKRPGGAILIAATVVSIGLLQMPLVSTVTAIFICSLALSWWKWRRQ